MTPSETTNSQVQVQGDVSAGIQQVWLHVIPPGQVVPGDGATVIDSVNDLFLTPVNGHFSTDLFMRNGAGAYQIQINFADVLSVAGLQSYDTQTTLSVQNDDTRDLTGCLPSQQAQSDDPEIIATAQTIVATVADPSNLVDKARAIHDWVAAHLTYDTKAFFADTQSNITALDALHAGTAECDGYAMLFAALARAAGMQAVVIDGMALNGVNPAPAATDSSSQPSAQPSGQPSPEPSPGVSPQAQPPVPNHAWNQVWVGDRWLVLDTTWDSGAVDMTTQKFIPRLGEQYFDPLPAFFDLTHLGIDVDGS